MPSLLVYGAITRLKLTTDSHAAGIFSRARAVAKEIKYTFRNFSQLLVQNALHLQNGSNVFDVHKVPLGDQFSINASAAKY